MTGSLDIIFDQNLIIIVVDELWLLRRRATFGITSWTCRILIDLGSRKGQCLYPNKGICGMVHTSRARFCVMGCSEVRLSSSFGSEELV